MVRLQIGKELEGQSGDRRVSSHKAADSGRDSRDRIIDFTKPST